MGETSETNITITELYKLYFHYHYGGNIVNQHYNNRVVQIIFSLYDVSPIMIMKI